VTVFSNWRAIAFAVAIGTLGGAIFKYLTIPLPWLLGSMVFTTAAAMSGLGVAMPRRVRDSFLTILGVLLGAGFTPAIISRMHEWIVTMAALTVWAAVAGTISYAYLRRVAGFDRATAFFSATPGGLAEMTAVGAQMGGSLQTLALIHSLRVMLVVLIVPIWFRFEGMVGTLPMKALVGLFDISAQDYAVLAACAVVGAIVGKRLHLPAAPMLGPMICSIAVHLAGITDTQPPYVLTAAAQVVLGAAIGQRFAGMKLRTIGVTILHAAATTLLMLGLAVAFAMALAAALGQTLPGLVLSFAPGGFAEMSLVALALGIDPAIVSSHHLYRIVLVVSLAPYVYRRWIAGAAPS
jgi:membrane AbrB-like protein